MRPPVATIVRSLTVMNHLPSRPVPGTGHTLGIARVKEALSALLDLDKVAESAPGAPIRPDDAGCDPAAHIPIEKHP